MANAHSIRHPANFKDITGLTFGRLTVLSQIPNGSGKTKWLCRCNCGTQKTVIGSDLKTGKTQSCGCLSSENTIKSNIARTGSTRDLTGLIVGYLTVESPAGKLGENYAWKCRCRCGNITTVRAFSLTGKKKSKSCGCLQAEKASGARTHGEYTGGDNPTFSIYRLMVCRCTDSTNRAYKDYGGRGITVCDRWLGDDGFANFTADMGPRESTHLTLDRQDNNKGYAPDNCRWATRKQQNRNTRANRMITFQGETLCLSAWAERIGLRTQALWLRLETHKWTLERALTTPKAKRFL